MRVRLLRGQVVIREDLEAATRHYKSIVVPGVLDAERYNPDARQEARAWHRGTVLAMGAPMLTPTGAEVEPGFVVGDDVIFHWLHLERGWTRRWTDGELAAWVPQYCVDAVVNETWRTDLEHDPDAVLCRSCRLPHDWHLFRQGNANSRGYCPTEVDVWT